MASTTYSQSLTQLRDGSEVLIGPLGPDDAPLLADAFASLSEESRRLRFLGPKPRLTEAELRYLTEIDGHNHVALCAIDPTTERGVAIGRFVRDPRDRSRAEVAITVTDDWQSRGLGKLLLARLADRAREEDVRSFTALVSTENRNMRRLLERMDEPAHVTRINGGVSEWEIELDPKGVGAQLEEALRAAAAGHLQVPPRVCEVLRTLVPLRLTQRLEGLPGRFDLPRPPKR
jgi:protein lysine acetyltransferase